MPLSTFTQQDADFKIACENATQLDGASLLGKVVAGEDSELLPYLERNVVHCDLKRRVTINSIPNHPHLPKETGAETQREIMVLCPSTSDSCSYISHFMLTFSQTKY